MTSQFKEIDNHYHMVVNNIKRINHLKNEVKKKNNTINHWIDKYSELEEFIFDLLHSNDNLNIKYGSKFDEIRNK